VQALHQGEHLFVAVVDGEQAIEQPECHQCFALFQLAAPALEQIVEITELARPRASVAVTSVVISAVLRRAQPLRS